MTATYTPAPHVTPAEFFQRLAELKRTPCREPTCFVHARFPQHGPTARWVKPSQYRAGEVMCPTCGLSVELALWFRHTACGIVSRAQALPHLYPPTKTDIPEPRRARKYFAGNPPAAGCARCRGSLQGGFSDCVVPRAAGGNGHSWGFLCGMCALQYGAEYGTGRGQRYERTRSGRYLKVEG